MCSSSISPLGLFQGLRGWKKGPWNPELLGKPKLEEELIWPFFWTNLNFHGIKFLDSYFKIYLQIVANSKKLESILTFLSFLYKKNCDKVKNPLLFSSTPPFLVLSLWRGMNYDINTIKEECINYIAIRAFGYLILSYIFTIPRSSIDH